MNERKTSDCVRALQCVCVCIWFWVQIYSFVLFAITSNDWEKPNEIWPTFLFLCSGFVPSLYGKLFIYFLVRNFDHVMCQYTHTHTHTHLHISKAHRIVSLLRSLCSTLNLHTKCCTQKLLPICYRVYTMRSVLCLRIYFTDYERTNKKKYVCTSPHFSCYLMLSSGFVVFCCLW